MGNKAGLVTLKIGATVQYYTKNNFFIKKSFSHLIPKSIAEDEDTDGNSLQIIVGNTFHDIICYTETLKSKS